MAKVNGTTIKILIGGTTLSNVDKCTLATDRAMIDVTTKDSSSWKEVMVGLRSATMTCSGIVDYSATGYTPQAVYSALVAGTLLAVIFYDSTTGQQSYTASGYLGKCSFDAGTEDAEKFSLDITITGAVTQTATT